MKFRIYSKLRNQFLTDAEVKDKRLFLSTDYSVISIEPDATIDMSDLYVAQSQIGLKINGVDIWDGDVLQGDTIASVFFNKTKLRWMARSQNGECFIPHSDLEVSVIGNLLTDPYLWGAEINPHSFCFDTLSSETLTVRKFQQQQVDQINHQDSVTNSPIRCPVLSDNPYVALKEVADFIKTMDLGAEYLFPIASDKREFEGYWQPIEYFHGLMGYAYEAQRISSLSSK